MSLLQALADLHPFTIPQLAITNLPHVFLKFPFFLSPPFPIFSLSKQSMSCCHSGAPHDVIRWPARVLHWPSGCQQTEGIQPVNHSVILQYTGAQSDKILYGVAFEFVREVWHMRVLGFASKRNLYFDKGGVSSVHRFFLRF